uniref:Uncharacterized protein n=1 Tax=Amphimedon queenslandica TaxID=400682 RepID=A0A1X7V4X5_AMPQE
ITLIYQQQSSMMPLVSGMHHCYYFHPVVMAVAQYLQYLQPLMHLIRHNEVRDLLYSSMTFHP